MNGESVNRVNSEVCDQEEIKLNKPWQAPVVEVVGLVRETENGASPGPDMFSLS
ncbi:MAG: hypothetical protein HY881_21665 [Deltaproteobacteria bacterium]|nr:hypothetical protein [Deltaproteobacteria bacterium]